MDGDGDQDLLLANDANQANRYWENLLGVPDTHAPVLRQFTVTPDASGLALWDGEDQFGNVVAPRDLKLELQTFEGGTQIALRYAVSYAAPTSRGPCPENPND